MDLGKKYGFPRGFPIIWQPNKALNMYGFYPKFKNDEMCENAFNKSELDGCIEINFNFSVFYEKSLYVKRKLFVF